MKFGLLYEIEPVGEWGPTTVADRFWESLEEVRVAETVGFTHVFVVEHHFLGQFSVCPSPEVWLSAVAQHTETIRIGHGARLLPFNYNHPIRSAEMAAEGYSESWVTYSTANYSAKELTVFPGRSVTISDRAAHGLIVTQGRGRIGAWDVHTPAMIRYGELTADEYFVTAAAAEEGVRITNDSPDEKLVMLKHFGPDNPDARKLVREG